MSNQDRIINVQVTFNKSKSLFESFYYLIFNMSFQTVYMHLNCRLVSQSIHKTITEGAICINDLSSFLISFMNILLKYKSVEN